MKKLFALTFLAVVMSFASFALTPITGVSSVCAGSTAYVADSSSPGGTWSSSNTAVATITTYPPYAANVYGVAAGTATITYTVSGSSVYMLFTVNPMPAAITGITTICVGSTSTFSDATSGGVWSSFNPSIASIGSASGITTGVSAGYNMIEYSIGSCIAYQADTVVGAPYPGTISGPSSVCPGSTMTLSDIVSGGVWSSSNTSVATISSSGVVAGVSLGTSIISYVVTGTCGTSTAVKTVSVATTLSAGVISGTGTVIAGSTQYLSETVGGGVWSSSNTGVATISSSGVVTAVAAGTTTISYTVTGCGGTATATAVDSVAPYDVISGTISFTGSPYVGSVKVWLITYDPSTLNLAATDSTYVYCSSGTSVTYQFLGNPTDSFRIKAATVDTPVLIGTYGYVPTYHTSSYYWYSANVLPHVAGTADINQNITMGTGTITSGPGFVGGNVTSGANKGTGSTAVAGLQVYLLSSGGAIMQQAVTDASGNYGFSNVPYGTYSVFPEALNYKTTAFTSITVSAAVLSVSAANFIEHTVSGTITPANEGINNVTTNTASVFVFPNPSNGKMNIQWNTIGSETGNVVISDMTGREVYKSTLNMTSGTGSTQLNMSDLTNGIYMMSVRSASVNYNNKIEIQH